VRVFYCLEIGMSELNILFPKPVVAEVGGKSVKIYPVKLMDFELYGKEAVALMGALDQLTSERLLRYADDHSAGIRRVLLRTTSLTWLQVRRIDSVTAIQLFVEVVRVNSGFFGEALPGMVRALSGALSSSA